MHKLDDKNLLYLQLLPRRMATKTFTDNFVIGFLIYQDGEEEMEDIFFHVGLLQLSMVKAGFFIGGAIAI
jgi:hypothetical protein